jgi:hypothetical protein
MALALDKANIWRYLPADAALHAWVAAIGQTDADGCLIALTADCRRSPNEILQILCSFALPYGN